MPTVYFHYIWQQYIDTINHIYIYILIYLFVYLFVYLLIYICMSVCAMVFPWYVHYVYFICSTIIFHHIAQYTSISPRVRCSKAPGRRPLRDAGAEAVLGFAVGGPACYGNFMGISWENKIAMENHHFVGIVWGFHGNSIAISSGKPT